MSSVMGVFRVRVRVFPLTDTADGRELEMVVDTGAFRTVVPHEVVGALGLRPEKRATFRLADGSRITRDLGWVGVALRGSSTHTLAILGEPGDEPVLGALTLEELSLEVDPSRATLRPAEELLLAALPA